MGSQASSSSAVLSSLASMDLAQGFLPHKPIKKREKGERVYVEREREREGEGNPLCTTAVYNRPCTAPHECPQTSVKHTSVRCFRRLASTLAGHQLLTSYSRVTHHCKLMYKYHL